MTSLSAELETRLQYEPPKPWGAVRIARETRSIHKLAESKAPGVVTRRSIAETIIRMNTGASRDVLGALAERATMDIIRSQQPQIHEMDENTVNIISSVAEQPTQSAALRRGVTSWLPRPKLSRR